MRRLIKGLALMCVAGLVASASAQDVRIEKIDTKIDRGRLGQLTVLGELRIPQKLSGNGDKLPLVLLLPNGGGLDGTGPQYSHALNQRGIATIDLNTLNEMDFMKDIAMALGATRIAVEKFGLDGRRVGIMGFSQGAMESLIASSDVFMTRLTNGIPFRFKAAAALYPACGIVYDSHSAEHMNWKTGRAADSGDRNPYKGMFDKMTGNKILVLAGENEDYEDAPTECPKLVRVLNADNPELAQLTIYPGVGHGWDVPVSRTYSHSAVARKSGTIRHHRFEKTFELSRAAVVEFFVRELQAQ